MIGQLLSLLVMVIMFFVAAIVQAQPIPIEKYPGQWLDPLTDYGYCGQPKRDARGAIIRDPDVPKAFQEQHPCPSTGLRFGPCLDWYKDHVKPLACGGCDSVSNMQWLHKSIKSGAATIGFYPKDRIERKVYGLEPPVLDTDNCTYVTPERVLK